MYFWRRKKAFVGKDDDAHNMLKITFLYFQNNGNNGDNPDTLLTIINDYLGQLWW